jgi:hypothetical protein
MRIPLQTRLSTFEALNEHCLNFLYLTSAFFEYSLYFFGSAGQACISGAAKKTFGVESLP